MKRIIPLMLGSLLLLLSFQQCTWENELEAYSESDSCNVANVTYTDDIEPILEENCIKCHGNQVSSSNLNFTMIEDVLKEAKSGELSGVINHRDGYPEMPRDGNKLPECTIRKIDKWIDDLP